jgi:four helix bundle protein
MMNEKGKIERLVRHGGAKVANSQESNGRTVDIVDRTFQFALRIVKLCRFVNRKDSVGRTLSNQLLRSATSVGANVEEAQAGQTRADFVCKMTIALKEARESLYWLRLLRDSEVIPAARIDNLCQESLEIAKIIGAIVRNTRARPPNK